MQSDTLSCTFLFLGKATITNTPPFGGYGSWMSCHYGAQLENAKTL